MSRIEAGAQAYDDVIVGGGHNGLAAAAYLARAGRSVLLLERSDHLGGATVSAPAFPGVETRLSRYSYLVSLLPPRIVADLGLRLVMRRRRYSSYTPVGDAGLLIDHGDAAATRASFERLGAAADVQGWAQLYADTARLADAIWPTMTEPLPRRRDVTDALGAALTADFIDRPLGEALERRLTHDVTRGVALTDALIGTFAAAHEADLRQNRCFLYHVVGGGTGDWDVPVGGMGQVSAELARVARCAGADLRTGCEVTAVDPDRVVWLERELGGSVRERELGGSVLERELGGNIIERSVDTRQVVWAAAPAVLDQLRGTSEPGLESQSGLERVEGAQVKVNLLLTRLPRLREQVAPEAAFGGTFHINESYSQLAAAHARAAAGAVPDPLPAEIYCHSITDPTILGERLRTAGAHTLTVFALHTPDRLVRDLPPAEHDAMRSRLQAAVLASLNSVLAEPIESLLATDGEGRPCVETKTTQDLQAALAMPGGNIFHAPLTWPFAQDDEPLQTPAQRWGVDSGHDGILLAGAGSRRGGGVSALGGYHAARAALQAGQ